MVVKYSTNYIKRIDVKDVFIATVVSLVIIVLSLLTKSFWGDEIFSINFSPQSFNDLFKTVATDYHPPFYFILLKIWIGIFGESEIPLRVFQALQGILLILSSLVLFRKLFPDYMYHPLWVLWILSSELWLFMPMLRYYTLAAILVIVSSYMFLCWLENANLRTSTLLLTSYIFLLYTDYPSSIVILLHLIYLFFVKRQLVLRLVSMDIISAVFFTPWVFITIKQVYKLVESQRVADLNLSLGSIPLKIAYSIYAFFFGETVYPFEIITIGALLIIVTVFIVSYKNLKLILRDRYAWFVLGLLITGILFTSLVTTFISKHTSFIYTPSRTFFCLAFFYLLLASVYSSILNKSLRFLFLGSILVVNIYGIINWTMGRHFIMPVYATPWKGVLRELEGRKEKILVDESLCYNYYRKILNGTYPDPINPLTVGELYAFLDKPKIYVIMMGRESTEPEIRGEVIKYIQNNGKKFTSANICRLMRHTENLKPEF